MRKSIKLVLVATFLITLSGGIVIIGTWDKYTYSNSYYYDPSIPPSNPLVVDLTSLCYPFNIIYISSPSAPIVKIDLEISIKGAFVAVTSFSDFFSIYNWTDIYGFLFGVSRKSSLFYSALLKFSLIKEKIEVTINLRSDITYDIQLS